MIGAKAGDNMFDIVAKCGLAQVEGVIVDHLHFAGQSVTAQPWLDALGDEAVARGWLPPGRALRVRSLPWPLLRVMGLVAPTFAALADMRYLWRTPHRLDNTRLRALIGDEPHTPFDQAVRQALADLGLVALRSTRAALA